MSVEAVSKPSARVRWQSYRPLFEQGKTDNEIAELVGVSPDAARLARKRFENPADGYIGLNQMFFDIEATSLTAIMGRLLCASFSDPWGRITTFRIDQTDRQHPLDDRSLAVEIREHLEKADIIVGWNSKLYDVPFINARLLRWGERPIRKDIKHIDLMYYARGQFVKIGSSKLVNVQKFVPEVENSKTDVDWDIWQLAGMGDQGALRYVVEHCEADILVLRDVFGKLKDHVANIHR